MDIMPLPVHNKFIRLFLVVSFTAKPLHNESRSMKWKHNQVQELRPLVTTANVLNTFYVSETFSVHIVHYILNIITLRGLSFSSSFLRLES